MVNKGIKYDNYKLRYDLFKPEVLEELAKVLDYGARKYNDDNWRLVEYHRYIAALFRHLQAHSKGELRDGETGYYHLSHVMTCIAILVQKHIEEDALSELPLIKEFIKAHRTEIDTLNEMIYLQEYYGEGGNGEQRY